MNGLTGYTSLEFLAGGGEMGQRIRNFDWAGNPLGRPEQWPQSLKTCIRIMLSSKQPIWIGWGSELTKLYNDAYIDIVRGKHPHALGEPASVVWKDIWRDIEPLLSRAMLRDEGTYVESRLLIMQRSGFPEETYYTFSYTPVLGDDGHPAGIICYNTADTERIINERALKTMQQLDTLGEKKNEEAVFQQVARALTANPQDFPFAVIYKVSEDGTLATRVAISGVEAANHDRIESSIALQEAADGYEIMGQAVSQNKIAEGRNVGPWENLSKGSWDVSPRRLACIPIQAANKPYPTAVLAVGLNPYRKFDDAYRNFLQLIAERVALGIGNVMAYAEERRRLKALEELDKAKTLFFTNISHEFRTPLMLMLGPLEEMLKKEPSSLSDAEKAALEVTHRNALRLLKLVNTLLDFSRIESGRNEANFVLTDISDYTQNLASNFRSVIEKAGLRFEVLTEKNSAMACIDRQMWEKVVFNLLSNAFKYTLQGTITLTLRTEGGQVILTVRDTGVGIPEAELPRMFERFHRVQNSAGRTYEGTGIGLSLIKQLVTLHGGSISVESEVGVGSSFEVKIPFGNAHLPEAQVHDVNPDVEEAISDFYLREAETLLVPESGGEVGPETGLPQKRTGRDVVLIVDDNADMRRHITSLIGSNYDTLTAGNGLEALEKIRKCRPCLVLSDIMMPELDGVGLLKEVKQDPEIAQTPIILITARAGEESRIEGFEIGADDYLVKPFSTNELLARIKAQVRMSRTRKQTEDRLAGFLMQMPAAVAVVEGPDFRCSLANEMFQTFAGLPASDLKGRPLTDALPQSLSQHLHGLFTQVYHSLVPWTGYEVFLKWDHGDHHKSGFFDIVIYPVKDDGRNVRELMFHAVETTLQAEARVKLESSEKQFRTLTETLPQLVWMTDAAGKLLFASGRWADYSGVVPQDESDWRKVVHPDDYARVDRLWTQSLGSAHAYKLEVRLRNKLGDYRWHYGQGEPILSDAGEVVSWIGAFSDIHDQRMFTDELEKKVEQRTQDLLNANKELESFNYVASHDLQEPLRKIQTFIHLIEKSSFDGEASRAYFRKIYTSAQRMSELIQSVLTYSRLSKTGDMVENVDLNQLVEDIKTDFELLIEERQATVVGYGLPVVRGNQFQLNQLFSNLISNSLKFSTVPPVVTITYDRVEASELPGIPLEQAGREYHRISVSDNGIGFEPEFREKIFMLFQRLHGKHEYAGTGIGLSIVKKIVEQHNGFIEAESIPGQGATFHIWLPV